jgi:hypothetical protein
LVKLTNFLNKNFIKLDINKDLENMKRILPLKYLKFIRNDDSPSINLLRLSLSIYFKLKLVLNKSSEIVL